MKNRADYEDLRMPLNGRKRQDGSCQFGVLSNHWLSSRTGSYYQEKNTIWGALNIVVVRWNSFFDLVFLILPVALRVEAIHILDTTLKLLEVSEVPGSWLLGQKQPYVIRSQRSGAGERSEAKLLDKWNADVGHGRKGYLKTAIISIHSCRITGNKNWSENKTKRSIPLWKKRNKREKEQTHSISLYLNIISNMFKKFGETHQFKDKNNQQYEYTCR